MIALVLQLYIWVTIIDILLSYMPQMRSHEWAQMIHKATDVVQAPIRDLFPRDIPLDPAPMIVIIVCQMLIYLVS